MYKGLLAFLFALNLSFSFAQSYGWSSNLILPGLGRDDAICFTIDKKVFVGTGNHGGFSESNNFYAYNTRNQMWVDVAPFPGVARQYASVEVYDFKAYLIGGIDENNNPLNDVWMYDNAENSWTQLDSFPGLPRWKAASFQINGSIYYGTGQFWGGSFNDFWKFNPTTEDWIQLENIPILPRNETVSFAVYDEGYLGLGIDCTNTFHQDIWKFDPETEDWNYQTDFPGGKRFYAIGEVLNGHAFVGTGEDEFGNMYNDFWSYNPSTNLWEQAENVPLPARRGVASCAIPFKAIYFANGLSDNFVRLQEISRYTARNLDPPPLKVFYQFQDEKVFIYDLPYFSIIRLLDARGRLMFETYDKIDHLSVDVSSWKQGVYIVWVDNQAVKFMVH